METEELVIVREKDKMQVVEHFVKIKMLKE